MHTYLNTMTGLTLKLLLNYFEQLELKNTIERDLNHTYYEYQHADKLR
jgi:hypothetical protein